ncbi:prolipoprotein diacylglyceryl transferase [Tepidicaulis sp.]|uniref:prolipoprotein diacylglyceryl transferase n=1 Tax=Tepidicaulis sp. TaxID=1920809 RepID=UPI003B58E913
MPFPDIDPVLIQIGPFAIRWYALAYIAGLLLGWRYIVRLTETSALWGGKGPATREEIDDLLLWAALGVILGGRLGYVLFYKPAYYFANPGDIIAVWEGGMSFHGGFLGVVLAIVLFARRKEITLWPLGDMVAAATPIGLFFGRIANFINAELWGRPSDAPWAVVFPTDPLGLPRHPSQLYEAALEGILLFILLRFLTHHTDALKKPGTIVGAFITGYGASRICVEFFREPDAHIGYYAGIFTQGMLLSLPMVLIGLAIIFWAQRRMPQPQAKPASKKPRKKS